MTTLQTAEPHQPDASSLFHSEVRVLGNVVKTVSCSADCITNADIVDLLLKFEA